MLGLVCKVDVTVLGLVGGALVCNITIASAFQDASSEFLSARARFFGALKRFNHRARAG